MHDPFHAGGFGGIDKLARVFHGARLSVFTLIETYPIRIDQYIHILQTASQARFIKAQREGFDLAAKWIGSIRVNLVMLAGFSET